MKITILGCGGSFGSPLAWNRHGNIDLDNKRNFRTRSSVLIDYKNTNIGYSVSIHQFQVIGSYCMLGMGSIVPKGADLKCGTLWYGSPAKFKKYNEVGLQRNELAVEDMKLEDDFICENTKERCHVLNAISPAFTASFAFADLVIERMKL